MEKELLRFAQLNNLLWEQIQDVKKIVAALRAPSAEATPSPAPGPSPEEARAAQELTERITKRMAAQKQAAQARLTELQEKLDNGGLSEEEQEEYQGMWKFY